MTSSLAIAELEQMKADGLSPSFDDIIRLNALALKVEAATNKKAVSSIYYLPRACKISDKVGFRQPAIGHEVWIAKIDRLCAKNFETALAVKAFALSRPPSALPDPDDPKSVITAVETFATECADFTRDQIFAALEYVIFGASETAGEHPATPKTDETENADGERVPDGTEGEDWKECVAAGSLIDGQIALWGMNIREVEMMTRRQLDEVIRRSCVYHGLSLKDDSEELRNEFYATSAEIRERLEKEKNQ